MRALDLPVQFLLHLLAGKEERVEFGNDKKLSTVAIYRLFTEWARDNGVRECNYTERTFALSLNKVIKSKALRIEGKAVKGYELDRESFVTALCNHLRMTAEELEAYM